MTAGARGAARLRAATSGGGRLVAYLTFGDPTPAVSVEAVRAAAAAGADVIELGIPFSDPSADGPAIQAAMQRALATGGSLAGALDGVRRLRASGCDVPIVLFGYYNPIFVRGVERFVADAVAAGADGALVVDLPLEEIEELAAPARAAGLGLVPLVAPTSTPDRIARAAALAPPFVYAVSITGVTGAGLGDPAGLERRVAEVRRAVGCPVAVGFGIQTPADAAAVGRFADAVVVGTALVRALERDPASIGAAVAAFKAALGPRAP